MKNFHCSFSCIHPVRFYVRGNVPCNYCTIYHTFCRNVRCTRKLVYIQPFIYSVDYQLLLTF